MSLIQNGVYCIQKSNTTIFLLDFRVDDDLYDVKKERQEKNSNHKKKIWKLV